MKTSTLRDIFMGCILGGAFGDALGYPIEFLNWRGIREKYGPKGVQNWNTYGRRLISDDTQMTLYTMDALSTGIFRVHYKGIGGEITEYIGMGYLDWYAGQAGMMECPNHSRFAPLFELPGVNAWRAPGNACMSALREIYAARKEQMVPFMAVVDRPVNKSKGCGGVMRVAPLGLMLQNCWKYFGKRSPAEAARQAAAITHGHPLGFLPAAFLGQLIYDIRRARRDTQTRDFGHGIITTAQKHTLSEIVTETVRWFLAEYPCAETTQLIDLITKARIKAIDGGDDVKIIEEIGGGWVGDEALAIAIYACERYPDDFPAAMRCAVNHSGDSDSTGSIAGNILGAYLGFAKMDEQLQEAGMDIRDIELFSEMTQLIERALHATGWPEDAQEPKEVDDEPPIFQEKLVMNLRAKNPPLSHVCLNVYLDKRGEMDKIAVEIVDCGYENYYEIEPRAISRFEKAMCEETGGENLGESLRRYFADHGDHGFADLLNRHGVPTQQFHFD